jgi:hypothetical protein
MRALVIIAIAGCASSQSGSHSDDGDAARIICIAECQRFQRCGHDQPTCMPRCARLTVRNPAVWSADWARDVASCIATTECEHDSEERCVFATTRHTEAADVCFASGDRAKLCPVLNGLTPDSTEHVRACYLAGGGERCVPRLDWK